MVKPGGSAAFNPAIICGCPGREATINGATKGISAARCQWRSPKNESAPIRQNSAHSGASPARRPSSVSMV